MAFKFTVDYKQLRLIIQTDSTESVSLFEHLKSTVDFIDLQQIVAFQQLTAADVNIDADTLNRYFTEQYNSPNAESFGFSDAQTLATNLAKTDSPVISEILAKELDKALKNEVVGPDSDDMKKMKKDATKKGEKEPMKMNTEEESFDIEKLKEDVNTLWSNAAKDLEEMKKNAKYMKAQDVAPDNDTDSEKDEKKGKTLVGSKQTKVETEPKVDYVK